jgi:hypothetical protein
VVHERFAGLRRHSQNTRWFNQTLTSLRELKLAGVAE